MQGRLRPGEDPGISPLLPRKLVLPLWSFLSWDDRPPRASSLPRAAAELGSPGPDFDDSEILKNPPQSRVLECR